jgi:hypothetical protein
MAANSILDLFIFLYTFVHVTGVILESFFPRDAASTQCGMFWCVRHDTLSRRARVTCEGEEQA